MPPGASRMPAQKVEGTEETEEDIEEEEEEEEEEEKRKKQRNDKDKQEGRQLDEGDAKNKNHFFEGKAPLRASA